MRHNATVASTDCSTNAFGRQWLQARGPRMGQMVSTTLGLRMGQMVSQTIWNEEDI
jgi:hypothetical protein